MLHLLPEEQKQKVATEYKRRVLIVLSLGVLVIMLFSVIFLLPAYLSSFGKYATVQKIKADLESHIKQSENNEDADKVKDIVSSVEILKNFSLTELPTDIYERIIKNKPRGVTINHFVYTPNESAGVSTEPSTVDLSGVADTRARLLQFNDALKRDRAFKSVQIPLSSFAKERAIDYSIKLIISNNKSDWGYLPVEATSGVSVTASPGSGTTPNAVSPKASTTSPQTP